LNDVFDGTFSMLDKHCRRHGTPARKAKGVNDWRAPKKARKRRSASGGCYPDEDGPCMHGLTAGASWTMGARSKPAEAGFVLKRSVGGRLVIRY